SKQNDDTIKLKLLSDAYPGLFVKKQKILGNFIKRYPSSPISAYEFNEFAGDERIDIAIVEPIYNFIAESIKNHPLVKKVAERMALNKRTMPGANAIEFSQIDTAGNVIKFSSLKGKYVLIDFWAGWCVPCREQNPHLRDVYEKYKKDSFEILGVSLDGERK